MIDACILLFWLICLIRGCFRGALKELFAMLGVPIAVVAAAFGCATLLHRLPEWLGSSPWRGLTAFVTLFAGIYLLMTIVGVIASYLLRSRRRGRMDRLLGAGFGTAKGILVVSAVLIPMIAFLPKPSLWIGASVIVPYEELLAEQLTPLLPSAIQDPFRAHIEKYRRSWNHPRSPSIEDRTTSCNQSSKTGEDVFAGCAGQSQQALRVNIGMGS